MKGTFSMSTLSHKRCSAFHATKSVIYICDVHFELYEDNTPNAVKWLNFKICIYMIQFLYLVPVIGGNLLFDDAKLAI